MGFYNQDIETMQRGKMESLQLSRLQNMVSYCIERVPYYREKLAAAGITSGRDIISLSDIQKIPFTTKEEVSNHYPDGLLAVPKEEIRRIHASSGTTGKPTIGYYTEKDLETWADASARVLCLNGLEKNDILQISVGYGLFTGALGFHQGAEKIGCTIIPASTGSTQKQLVMMHDMGVTALMATPSYATYLADLISQSQYPREEIKIKKILLGAERCTPSMKASIENALGVTVSDNYGLTECFGPGVAGDCECHNGMHISEDVFYPEIIDPETGRVLPDGEEGELVFTSLFREAMPLLRYRTRDITSITHQKCACGRTTVRMKAPSARTDDMFVFKGVNVFPSQIEYALAGIPGLSPHYLIRLERDENRDTAKLFIELEKPVSEYSDAELSDIKRNIQRHMEEVVIVRFVLILQDPYTLQRFTGKSKRVEDLRYTAENGSAT